MSLVGNGNRYNHWSKKRALEYLNRYGLNTKGTPRELIKRASDDLYDHKIKWAIENGITDKVK